MTTLNPQAVSTDQVYDYSYYSKRDWVYLEIESDQYQPQDFPGTCVLCVYKEKAMKVLIYIPTGVDLKEVDSWGFPMTSRWLHLYQVEPTTIKSIGEFGLIFKVRGEYQHLNPILRAILILIQARCDRLVSANTTKKTTEEHSVHKRKAVDIDTDTVKRPRYSWKEVEIKLSLEDLLGMINNH